VITRLLTITLWLSTPLLFSQTMKSGELQLSTGKEIYDAGCLACHGPDGKGMPQSTVGFDTPLPDFTDCNFAAREADPDWIAIIHNGGPARGFSEIMPSFAEALNAKQIQQVVDYVRGFCPDRSWPRGELNLPRALVTEKAFPEDETVLTTMINATGAAGVSNRILYERRFGAGNQVEVAVPFRFQRQSTSGWAGGVGDMALGYKRLLAHSLRTGSILSLSGEAVLPTGNRSRGMGTGVTVFEAFATYGQLLPSDSFLQFQGGVRLPTHGEDVAKSAFWRTVLGRSWFQDKGFGRAWTPMVEVLADRSLRSGNRTNWDLLPQMQVTLSTRQHVFLNVGVRVPANHRGLRSTQVMFYLLWDWFDGGIRDGW